MRPLKLTRQRLRRLLQIIDLAGGKITKRDLFRSYSLFDWEAEQAQALGWITISMNKPRVGRPSYVLEKVSETTTAKLPPNRWEIPAEISFRHWDFVCAYLGGVEVCKARASYLAAFPDARSKTGASASANRLLKHPDVKAALAWIRACSESGLPWEVKNSYPWSAAEIRAIFVRYGHYRLRQL